MIFQGTYDGYLITWQIFWGTYFPSKRFLAFICKLFGAIYPVHRLSRGMKLQTKHAIHHETELEIFHL